jgi:MRG
MPDEATCTDEEMFEFVMNVLSRPPPPDEPEHMTVETFNSGHHWAPLIGGTSESERALIEEEARQMGLWTPKRRVHPQYEKARINDPLNANRLHFFENQDPERILVTSGVPKDPTNIDPPGSGTPFDALRYPDRLVQLPAQVLGNLTMADLQQLDRATILRFPNNALRMLPPRSLSKLKIPIPSENDSNDDCFQEEAFYARPSIHFAVPDMIKGYLVDDWENVTKSLTLVELPSKAPVNWVLDTYFHEEKGKRRLGSADADRLVEIIGGMKLYFEKMLGKTLLYKFERGQYAEV